jgi:hypothetical protein
MTMFNKGNLINVPLNELVANSESVGVKFVKITKTMGLETTLLPTMLGYLMVQVTIMFMEAILIISKVL